MLEILEVNAIDHADQAIALAKLNWAETGFDFALELSFERIAKMQGLGIMFALGAFDGGQLVAYSTAVVGPHHFNEAIVCCHSDALFVHPDYRKGALAPRLIDATERKGSERGASRMLWNTRAGTPFAAILERRGYLPADVVMMRRI